MHSRRPTFWPTHLIDLSLAPAFSSIILTLTTAYLGLGLLALIAWLVSGYTAWIDGFFKIPAAIIMVLLAVGELMLATQVMNEFAERQGLHQGWRLIAASAGCNVVSGMMVQVLSANSALNPFIHMGWWSDSAGAVIRSAGSLLNGPIRFGLLTCGLFLLLRINRQSGRRPRFARLDWILLATMACYVLTEAWTTTRAVLQGKHPGLPEILMWPVDPLLWLLLAEGLLLYRVVKQQRNEGGADNCWKAISIGVFLTMLGDISIWATSWGYSQWPWNSLEWYLWVPAAGAFALGPCYQLEAIWQSRFGRRDITASNPDF